MMVWDVIFITALQPYLSSVIVVPLALVSVIVVSMVGRKCCGVPWSPVAWWRGPRSPGYWRAPSEWCGAGAKAKLALRGELDKCWLRTLMNPPGEMSGVEERRSEVRVVRTSCTCGRMR